ncbi:hypothetical protein GCM10017688_64240 [Streptomyces ramulosus]
MFLVPRLVISAAGRKKGATCSTTTLNGSRDQKNAAGTRELQLPGTGRERNTGPEGRTVTTPTLATGHHGVEHRREFRMPTALRIGPKVPVTHRSGR